MTIRFTEMPLKNRAICKLMLIIVAYLICLDPSSAQTAPSPLVGDYKGMQGTDHLILHVRKAAGARLTATIDVIDQDAFGIQCANVTESGRKISFTLSGTHASYQGEISPDENTFTGTWTQQGSGALVFAQKGGTGTDYTGSLGNIHLILHLQQSAGTGATGTLEVMDQHDLVDYWWTVLLCLTDESNCEIAALWEVVTAGPLDGRYCGITRRKFSWFRTRPAI